MFYPIPGPDGVDVWPVHDDGREARWSIGKDKVFRMIAADKVVWKLRERRGEPVWIPYTREYAPDNPTRPHSTILLDVKTSRQAKAHQREVLPGIHVFDTVKPEQLVARVLDMATERGDLVLDSFLGSGTTAAVAHKMGRRYIGIEMGEHAVTHCAPRLRKVIEGEQGGISRNVGWKGGGGFRFYRLGPPVFDWEGRIQRDVRFPVLAAHVWFTETGLPWSGDRGSPLLGIHKGRAYALLYNGILGDRQPDGGNVLTRATLTSIRNEVARSYPAFAGEHPEYSLTVYGERSRLTSTTIARERVAFKQTPYDVRGGI